MTDIQAVAQLIGSDESFFEGEDAVWKDPVLEAQVLKASASLTGPQLTLIGLATRTFAQLKPFLVEHCSEQGLKGAQLILMGPTSHVVCTKTKSCQVKCR